MDRGFGVIEGMPPVRNGHFYMRHRAVNSSRSMLYDMDAQRGTHRLVADIGVEDMAFVLDPRGIPRFALGSTDYDTYVLYQANDEGKDWQPARSEGHTSELQSLMRISSAVFCLKRKTTNTIQN